MTGKTFTLTSTNFQVSSFLKRSGYTELDSSSTMAPDFVVSPGGSDVHPNLYFEKKLSGTHCNIQGDYNEVMGIMGARLAGIPQVGICKGFQLLHVLSGGTLIQHIQGHQGSAHGLTLNNGTSIQVTSSHHQAVPQDETNMYEEVYFAADGVTEAIISPSRNWGGVQWHPEYHLATPENQKFFLSIIEQLTTKSETK